MGRWLVGVAVLALLIGSPSIQSAASQDAEVTVTSTSDAPGTCPHSTACTLRTAIAVVNAGGEASVIRFDPDTFPAAEPGVITVGTTPLPAITRNGAVVDGAGAGVIIRSGVASPTPPADGLRLAGTGVRVTGLTFERFSGACLVVDGAAAAIGVGGGNTFRDCGTGIRVTGPGANLQSNVITTTLEGPGTTTGVVVAASNVTVGGPAAGAGNLIERATTGLVVQGGATSVAGVRVEGNTFRDVPGTCLRLAAGSSGTLVQANAFERCGTGIAVDATLQPAPVQGNTFRSNTFSALGGLAIDLGADGIRNPPGAAPPGPNAWVQHPRVTRGTVAGIEGSACAGCTVEVYLAFHLPGGERDYGRVPVGPPVIADSAGRFTAAAAGLSPGQWVIATATDAAGNTSEFGPPARVGSGAVLCGNVQLQQGWNHVAFFGSQPLVLGNAFPSAANPAVTAIYQAVDGTTGYLRWLSATTAGRTLTSLQPGQEYWFLATTAVTLQGGFSVSFPVPVTLQHGWNDLTYIGGPAHVRDALISLAGKVQQVARWDAATQRWLRFGDGSAPGWALGFTWVEACTVYQVLLSEGATLQPLQP
jgi:hypothetical protein